MRRTWLFTTLVFFSNHDGGNLKYSTFYYRTLVNDWRQFGALLREASEMCTHTHYGGQRPRSRAARTVCLFSSHISYYLSVPKRTNLLLSSRVLPTNLKLFIFPCARYYVSFNSSILTRWVTCKIRVVSHYVTFSIPLFFFLCLWCKYCALHFVFKLLECD